MTVLITYILKHCKSYWLFLRFLKTEELMNIYLRHVIAILYLHSRLLKDVQF